MKDWSYAILNDKQAKGHIQGWKVVNEKKSEQDTKDKAKKKSKYGSKKVIIDGITFDSTKEGGRYLHLKMMQHAGLISNLRLQVPYLLIEANGKEKKTEYFADFVYIENGIEIVEDSKSSATRKIASYIIKRKLMLEKYQISILET